MMTVKIYSTPTCPFCKAAKAFLKEKKVPFEDVDVAEDEKGRDEMMQKSGQMSVPVIIVSKENKEEILVGFDQQKLSKAVGLEG